jgi:RNA polymerase sigma factor (sigma-70 family)
LSKTDYTDKEIIDGCSKGKLRFQELLYRRFYAFAISVCIRYNPNRDDAIEVLNDSFMKVFDNIQKFDQDKPFKSWFRRILVNTSLDRYRENKKFFLLAEYDVSELEVATSAEISGKMDADEILGLLASLPELYRVIFNLYEVEGYSHDEIAGMLDIAPGTSRSHLSRAKSMLRKTYNQIKTKPYNEAI